MLQCLVLLLIQECGRFLCPSKEMVWAGTEKVLRSFVLLQKREEHEIYLRCCEMIEGGWFSD